MERRTACPAANRAIFGFDEVRSWVTSPIEEDTRARLHSSWWLDVPETFDNPQQLHSRLAGAAGPEYEEVAPSLVKLFARHGGTLELRHTRFVWRVDFS